MDSLLTGAPRPAARLETGAPASASAGDGIKDVTTASFRADVLQDSLKQPVLVDFWAPWCGPCRQLAPVLEKAVRAAKGRVKLVKMNIDEHPEVAGQLGVQSIPAVIAFSRGQPADGFVGALPESQIKAFIERLVGPVGADAEAALAEAEALAKGGDPVGAIELLASLLAAEPAETRALALMARIHAENGDVESARAILALPDLPANDPAVEAARAAVDLAAAAAEAGDVAELEARVAADPDDHAARIELAIALNARGRRDEAVDALVASIKRDRAWNEGAARAQLTRFFEAWGLMDEASVKGRRKLSAVLFS